MNRTELRLNCWSWTESGDRRELKCWMEPKINEEMNGTELRLAGFNWSEDKKWDKENWVKANQNKEYRNELDWNDSKKRE